MQTKIGDVDVRLDRVTITGNPEIPNDQLTQIMIELGWSLQPDLKADCPWFTLDRQLSEDVTEQVAVFMRNQFQISWRLDTSNHLRSEKEKLAIQRVITLLHGAHLTRIDVAFDFINCKFPGMKHVIVDPRKSSTDYQSVDFRSGQGHFETRYVGKRRSLSMYRYYDKLVEQKKARNKVPDNITSWERLEIQLRGKRSDEWLAECKKMLNEFKLPRLSSLPVFDQVGLLIMIEHPEVFAEFGKEKKAKLRKLYKSNYGFNTSYADTALKIFEQEEQNLEKEIASFLNDLKN